MFDTGFDKNVEQTTKKPSKPVSDVFSLVCGGAKNVMTKYTGQQ